MIARSAPFASLAALTLATACGAVAGAHAPDAGPASHEGGSGTGSGPRDATPPVADVAPPPPEAGPNVFEAGPAPAGDGSVDLLINSSGADSDGAIASDGRYVFYTYSAMTSGVLMVCSAGGGPVQIPTAMWPGAVFEGDGVGELSVGAGRVYFEAAGTSSGTPAIVDCPVEGCGASPDTFAPVRSLTPPYSPALANDGTSLFWTDSANIYSCPLGATCPSPTVVAPVPAGASIYELFPSGGSVYWVNAVTGDVQATAIASGATSLVCTVPSGATLAVVGGAVYVAGALPVLAATGVSRCALPSGPAMPYAVDGAAQNVTTNGTDLFWLAGAGSVGGHIRRCAPGASCAAWTTLGANLGSGMAIGRLPRQGAGIASVGSEVVFVGFPGVGVIPF